MIVIENDILLAEIDPKGAELKSLIGKLSGIEYMWQGNPQFWGRTSPVLFPIVGTLKDNQYVFNNSSYQLPRHGFARDKPFTVSKKQSVFAEFELSCNEETLKIYPFKFKLYISYRLRHDSLTIEYSIQNLDSFDPLYFSVGAHPAFNIPLIENSNYEDYYIQLKPLSTPDRWPLNNEGLMVAAPEALPWTDNGQLYLSPDLFYNDALVFKNINAGSVALKSKKDEHGLEMLIKDFSHLGVWAAKDAPFVCIEPWNGLTDTIDHNGQLKDKSAIIRLRSNSSVSYAFSIKFF